MSRYLVLAALSLTCSALATAAAGQPHPQTSGIVNQYEISRDDRAMIDSACRTARASDTSTEYTQCLHDQIAALREMTSRPDLSRVASAERASIEAACRSDRQSNGPAAYYRCIGKQLTTRQPARGRSSASAAAQPDGPAQPAEDNAEASNRSALWAAALIGVGLLGAGAITVARTRKRVTSSTQEKPDSIKSEERPITPSFDPYAVLGVTPDATKEQIRAAYRDAMAKYHPDKVAHLGTDLQELATKRALDLNRALDMLNRR